MIFFLALRNITKNKKDSYIVIFLIAVITFLFFIGNSIINKAERNIRRSFIESLTGDVVIQKKGDVTMNLFGANAPIIDELFIIPVLPSYNAVMEIINEQREITGITHQVSGMGYMDMLGVREPALLCGIDAASYFSQFPGIILREGNLLQPGEYGVMITSERALRIESKSGSRPQLGVPILFTSGGEVGFKIREVPLVGIFEYENPGQFMNDIVIIDPQTVRVLNSIQVATEVNADDISNSLLDSDIDDIFNIDFTMDLEPNDSQFSTDLLQQFLRETSTEATVTETGGDWHFIILRLDKKTPINLFISGINKTIEPLGLTAVNWRIASGTSAILNLLVQALFNSGMLFISIVGVIAIINILLISVFKRVREIGTLRAIGASNSFIRSIIYAENLFISVIAGFIGIIAGYLFIGFISNLEIQIQNNILISLMNSNVIQVDFMPTIAVSSFFIAVLLGFAASVYPVEKAVRLEPVVAVRRG